MKQLFIKVKINDEAKPEILEEDRSRIRSFYEKNKNQFVEWLIRTADEVRRLKQNRFYWGCVLGGFVPAHFQTAEGAHEYYTRRFLTVKDELDLNDKDFLKDLNRINKYARKITEYVVEDNIVYITWVRSTKYLTVKQFTEYCEQIMLEGRELGIEFESIEEFDEYKNQR